jgi:hypothetical protein
VWVDRSADVNEAARCIIAGQTFDNGTLCSSEQAIIADRPIADALRDALAALGARWCSPEETRKLEAIVLRGRDMNPAIVGRSAAKVAVLAGFTVPESTTVLLAAGGGTGPAHPLSHEKLCPLLAWYEVDGHEAGCRLAIDILRCGGLGHTLGLHCRDEAVIRAFGIEKPVNRIVVNSPTSQGAVGFTTGLFPSLTLGCGSFGGNITSDNVGPQHLVNLKRLARVRPEFPRGHPAGGMAESSADRDRPVAAEALGTDFHGTRPAERARRGSPRTRLGLGLRRENRGKDPRSVRSGGPGTDSAESGAFLLIGRKSLFGTALIGEDASSENEGDD